MFEEKKSCSHKTALVQDPQSTSTVVYDWDRLFFTCLTLLQWLWFVVFIPFCKPHKLLLCSLAAHEGLNLEARGCKRDRIEAGDEEAAGLAFQFWWKKLVSWLYHKNAVSWFTLWKRIGVCKLGSPCMMLCLGEDMQVCTPRVQICDCLGLGSKLEPVTSKMKSISALLLCCSIC